MLIAVVIVRLKNNKAVTEYRVYQYDKQQSITVTVDTVEFQSAGETNYYAGTFEADKESKLSAEVQGKINLIKTDVGSFVNKGELLIELDNTLLKLQLKTIEVQLEALEKDVKRYKILTDADAAQGVQLEKSETALQSTQVQKESILEQIKKTSIVAPYSGIITAKFADEGSFAAPGVPLLQITKLDVLRFTVNVPEGELEKVKIGNTYYVTADAIQNSSLPAKAIMIGSKANAGNSFPIQFLVENLNGMTIKAGMFGKVAFQVHSPETEIVIPASAVQHNGNTEQVYVVNNNKAELRTIESSKNISNKIVVSKGLYENDVLVTSGFINLFDGAYISITR